MIVLEAESMGMFLLAEDAENPTGNKERRLHQCLCSFCHAVIL